VANLKAANPPLVVQREGGVKRVLDCILAEKKKKRRKRESNVCLPSDHVRSNGKKKRRPHDQSQDFRSRFNKKGGEGILNRPTGKVEKKGGKRSCFHKKGGGGGFRPDTKGEKKERERQ